MAKSTQSLEQSDFNSPEGLEELPEWPDRPKPLNRVAYTVLGALKDCQNSQIGPDPLSFQALLRLYLVFTRFVAYGARLILFYLGSLDLFLDVLCIFHMLWAT